MIRTPEEDFTYTQSMVDTAALLVGASQSYLEGLLAVAARNYVFGYREGSIDHRALGQMVAVLEIMLKGDVA